MEKENLLEEGYRLGEDGKYAEAELVFRKVLENESNPEAWYALGTTLDLQDKHSEAKEAYINAEAGYLRILKKSPDSTEAMIGLGLALRRLGREKEALDTFSEALLKDEE